MMPKIEKYLEYPQDTRWATDEEIMSPLSSAKLNITAPPFETAGLILKSDGKTVFVDGFDHHSMILGTTGSGKSRLLCMPMISIMANAGESFIATDPKGELFKMTSGAAREQGYQVVVLNFRDVSRSDMWNPLLIPYELYQKGDRDHAMSLLNDFVMTLAAADNTQEQFWLQMAQSLILANILLLFEAGKREEINMHSLSRLCLDYGRPQRQNAIYQLQEYMNPDSIAAMNYAGVCVDAEKTQSSIMSVVHSILRVFNTQEGLLRMMSDSTFDMRSFGRKKTAVYLIIPDEKSTFHFLVSIFTKQCYEMLVGEAHKEESLRLPVRVNFMLDEFANLPTIPDMPNMISAARSRNIRFHLVIQSMNQLISKYGHDAETISSNCENWVFLNSREYDCLEEISKRCGNLMDNRDQLRPLITPARLQRLDKARGEALIFHGRHYPYISYLADISKYQFHICEPVELKVGKRKPVSVFHADSFLQQLKAGERNPLFFEEECSEVQNGQTDVACQEPGRKEPEEPDFLKTDVCCMSEDAFLVKLCNRRMELTEAADFSRLLYYILDTQKNMEKIQDRIVSDELLYDLLSDRFDAECSYRSTELAFCCAVLTAEADDQEYRNWLFGIYVDTIRNMVVARQTFSFYPAAPARLDVVVMAGVAAAVHEIQNHRYSAARMILCFLEDYRACFFRYPGIDYLLHDLQEFLEALYDGAEKSRIFDCIQELKKPVSFQKSESADGAVMRLYRKKMENDSDKQILSVVLNYCQAECENFRKWMEEINV